MKNSVYLSIILCFALFKSYGQATHTKPDNTMNQEIKKTDEEWKALLNPEQYRVLRKNGTEAPFTGKYYLHKEKGIYACAACGNELFQSDAKFDSGCGWPSFSDVIDSSKVVYTEDKTLGMVRTEITCKKCSGHLGHVFNDGPTPKGQRYCINSVSIDFKK